MRNGFEPADARSPLGRQSGGANRTPIAVHAPFATPPRECWSARQCRASPEKTACTRPRSIASAHTRIDGLKHGVGLLLSGDREAGRRAAIGRQTSGAGARKRRGADDLGKDQAFPADPWPRRFRGDPRSSAFARRPARGSPEAARGVAPMGRASAPPARRRAQGQFSCCSEAPRRAACPACDQRRPGMHLAIR